MSPLEHLLDLSTSSNAPTLLTQPSLDQHLQLPVKIKSETVSLSTLALVDSGASSCFVDQSYAQQHKIPIMPSLTLTPLKALMEENLFLEL